MAALGSSFAFVTKTLAGLSVKTIVLALLVVSVLIAVPAGISAYYRLSQAVPKGFKHYSGRVWLGYEYQNETNQKAGKLVHLST